MCLPEGNGTSPLVILGSGYLDRLTIGAVRMRNEGEPYRRWGRATSADAGLLVTVTWGWGSCWVNNRTGHAVVHRVHGLPERGITRGELLPPNFRDGKCGGRYGSDELRAAFFSWRETTQIFRKRCGDKKAYTFAYRMRFGKYVGREFGVWSMKNLRRGLPLGGKMQPV